jgi:hypothetical protein
MKKFWRHFRSGILALIPIFLIVVLLNWGWSALNTVSVKFVDHFLLNLSINLVLIMLGIYLVGWLISRRSLRELLLKLCSKLPIISVLINFFLNHDYVERVSKGDLPEVLFRHTDDSWAFGTVTNELRLPAFPEDSGSQLTDWVVILGPSTAPLSVTSPIHLRKKSSVVFTGRFIKDTALTAASFGLNFQLDPKKFSMQEPQS